MADGEGFADATTIVKPVDIAKIKTDLTPTMKGSVWYDGIGAPTPMPSADEKDYYLDTASGDVYKKVLGVWTLNGNIKGADGVDGVDGINGTNGTNGTNGADGSVWFSAALTPSGGTGVDGDYSLDTSNGDVYKKIAGTWTLTANIKGANGTNGNNGINYITVNVISLTSSPTDAKTVYFGTIPRAPISTAAQSIVYVRQNCTIKIAEIFCYSGTAGTAESWSLYIRKNNTTDTLIATVATSAITRVFSNAALSIAMNSGDYFEIKVVNPTWATNPLTTIFGGYVQIEY